MKKYAEKFYNSNTWKNTRELYSKSVGGLCEDCARQGLIVAGEIVHHIKPITKENIANPDITLAWENLRLLCIPCHNRVHGKAEKRYSVDGLGHVHPVSKG